jgi:hypothetical protein
MFRRTLLILFAGALLAALAVIPASAQDATWTVSLYDQASGTVTRLAPSGETVDQFTLPMPDGFDSYSYAVATSPLGDKIAYVVEQVGDGAVTTPPSRLVVYDTNADSVVASIDLAEGTNQEGFNAASDSLTFSADGSQVLTSYYVPLGDDKYSLETVVLDVATGQVAHALSADTLAASGVQTDASYRTTVLDFPGETAALVMQPVFVDMDLSPAALNWNLTTGEAAPIAPDLVNALDYLPATGEALILTYGADPNATIDPNAPITMERIFNAVELFSSGDAQIIYRADTVNFARFVQNGERILVFTNFLNATLIERDGTELHSFTIPGGANSVASTPDGFVYYDPQTAGGLTFVTTADGSFTETPVSTEGMTFSTISVQDYQMIQATEEAAG